MEETAEIWDRFRARLQSDDIVLMRQIRELLALPSAQAAAMLSAQTSLNGAALRNLWALLVSIEFSAARQYQTVISGQRASGSSGVNASELMTRYDRSALLAKRAKERLLELGMDTGSSTSASREKQNRYVTLLAELSKFKADSPALVWTAETSAACERLAAQLELLLDSEPPDYLRDDILEAVATIREGIADQRNAAGELDAATDCYVRGAAVWDQTGKAQTGRACRLKLIAMIRRLAADFDKTIQELTAILERFPAAPMARAEIRVELAQTYASVDDVYAMNAELKAVGQELASLNYTVPDPDDPESALTHWMELAGKTCAGPQEFEAQLMGLVALYAAIFAIRGSAERDEKRASEYHRAATRFARLGEEMTAQAQAVLVAQSQERAAFYAEFSGQPAPFEPLRPPADREAERLAALQRLDQRMEELRAEIARLEEGTSRDDLLGEAREIERDAQQQGFRAVYAAALLLEADLHQTAQRYDEAIRAARTSFEVPREAIRDLTIGLWALDRIISANMARRDDAAISAACGEAIELLERHRYDINAPYSQSAYLQNRARYYAVGITAAYRCDDFDTVLERADLSKAGAGLRHPGPGGGADTEQLRTMFEAVSREIEKCRAAGGQEALPALADRRRVLWDLLAISRARSRGHIDSQPLTIQILAASLDEDEAVVYYYWLGSTTLLIAAFDRSRHLIIDKKSIAPEDRRQLEVFASFVQSLRGAHGYLDRAGRFSPLLLPDSIKPVLTGKRRLLLSPHRMLHALPLHALRFDGEYLIRQFAVTYIPNLGCLVRTYRAAAEQRVFAAGVREFHVPGESLNLLEESDAEVESVRRAYGDRGIAVETLDSPLATTGELRRRENDGSLSKFTCLHLATHGADVLGDNPMEAHLWLRDGRLDGLEIANWRLNAELVVLSACHSGQRTIAFRGMSEVAGDDIFGLQAAFFTAGAARVMGALWPVESLVASQLMEAFHRFRAAGEAPESALQRAMVDHLDHATLQSRKTYYWAPFYIAAIARPPRAGA